MRLRDAALIVAPATLARVAPPASAVANMTLMLRPPAATPFDSADTSSVEFAVRLTAPLLVRDAVEFAIASVTAVDVRYASDAAPPPDASPTVTTAAVAMASLSPVASIVMPVELVTSP